ncbi:hypothetical protein IMCC1989_1359 [gamma proteobacterium IMCC1989]|nr:hypothetical protein IMCC1989_1359 [gamma proteobacterium IMCC1989]
MAHYSNRHFFRQAPNHYLALYFDSKGIDVDTDINALKENDIDALQGILNPLEDALTASIEADFQGVNALAREGGINALNDEARFHGDDDFIEAMAAIDGFHAKAFYAFLNKRSYWQGAARFLHADNVSASYWKKRNDLPHTPPHVEGEDIKGLEKAISSFFYHKEGRGKNCIVEPYRRNQKEYFFAYPEDFAQSDIEWVGSSLQNKARHPAFEIIFVYSQEDGMLDIFAPKNRKAIPKLQEIFAQHILKMDTLPEGGIDKRVYELAPVVDDAFEFTIEPTSGIASVVVARLRVDLKQGIRRRITLEADYTKDSDAVYRLLDELNLPPYDVTQVGLKVTFEPVGGQRAKTKTFNITYPNSCALHYDGNDLKIREMLARSGIEPAPVKG